MLNGRDVTQNHFSLFKQVLLLYGTSNSLHPMCVYVLCASVLAPRQVSGVHELFVPPEQDKFPLFSHISISL